MNYATPTGLEFTGQVPGIKRQALVTILTTYNLKLKTS